MLKVHDTGMTQIFHAPTASALRRGLAAHALSALACLAATGLGVPAAAQTTPVLVNASGSSLPALGDGTAISPAAERKLGDSIVRSLYRDPDYLDDPVMTDYVQSLWQPLLQAARARGDLRPDLDDSFAWEILLSRERDVNAFALPGGYFGLYMGLVGLVHTRDELASVLGHEISHVTQRHFARKTDNDAARTPWMIGGMILGLIAASKSQSGCTTLNPCVNSGYDAANALIMGSQALAIQGALNYSRDMEREADRAGFGLASEAGFAPQGFVSMFEKLQQSSRNNDSGGFPYLRSHPLNTDRIADMQTRIGVEQANTKPLESDWQALLMAARARLLFDTSVDGLQRWQADVQPAVLAAKAPAQQAAALYGAALAALKLRAYAQAGALATQLAGVSGAPPVVDRLVRLLRTDIALAQDQVGLALTTMATPVRAPDTKDMSLDRAELLLRAQAQVRANDAARAATALYLWTVDHPRDLGAWRALGAAYEAQGRLVAAIRAQAQADGLQYDWTAALGRLRAAQDLVRKGQWGTFGPDHIEASIVDTRAREIVQLLREQANQQR
jgi:predicted Zn-dependent protease